MIHRFDRQSSKSNPCKRLSIIGPRLERLEDRLAPAGIFAVGSDAGGPPIVKVFDARTGAQLADFMAYDPHFLGGVRVAIGDVTGDGIPDIISAAGPGGGPHVKVFDGSTLSLITEFYAYDPRFGGGVNITAGDLNNDGIDEIITGAGAGGGPHVRVFDIANGQPVQSNGPLGSFYAYDPNFGGGVTVAAGNIDGKPGAELITGAGPGGGPHVKVFRADGTLLTNFYAYDASFTGGVYVASGDVNGDGRADIVTGPGAGGSPQVKVFSGLDGSLLDSFFAYSSSFSGGVRVAVADVNGDAHADIITGAGPGGGPHARVFDGVTLQEIVGLYALDPMFTGGIFSAGITIDNRANDATYVPNPEAPLLSRLARFVPSAVPSLSNWTTVAAGDANLDPSSNGQKSHLYVIAHGWAPGFVTMVQDNGTATNPLKWWQTLDTFLMGSPGMPASPEMFYGQAGDGIQISPSGLAYAITQADPKAVILAYSWIDDSATGQFLGTVPEGSYLSEAHTALNGTRLADALEMALPGAFHADGGLLHLIGHSHGSKVATVAAEVLTQTGNANDAVAHLTILDSPEDSSFLVRQGDAANNLWYFLGALNIGRSSGQTFVDNYISEFDNPIGPIQGFNPFNTSSTNSALQQVVDVNLNGGVLFSSTTDPGDLHAYSFNWYGGGSLAWAQNPTPAVADQWSPLLNPSTPATLSGSYSQTWQHFTDPQFALAPGPKNNTVTDTPTFTNMSYVSTSVTSGSTFDPATGNVVLNENGTSQAAFVGKFTPVSGVAGISFNYQFSNAVSGDQLVIWVNTGTFGGYQMYYVMTDSVAGTAKGIGTLTLTSLSRFFNYNIKIELDPISGSSGASVAITNLQQFTS